MISEDSEAQRAAVDRALERGVDFLIRTQRPDGNWDEPEFTGTGFPGDFSINYHLYRRACPIRALGRYLRGTAGHGLIGAGPGADFGSIAGGT